MSLIHLLFSLMLLSPPAEAGQPHLVGQTAPALHQTGQLGPALQATPVSPGQASPALACTGLWRPTGIQFADAMDEGSFWDRYLKQLLQVLGLSARVVGHQPYTRHSP